MNFLKSFVIYCFFLFNSLTSLTQITSTPNTNCNGVLNPCEYSGPSILINEINVSPSQYDGSIFAGADFQDQSVAGGGEWIELYNPHKCDAIDISGYILGTYNQDGDAQSAALGMGYSLPAGTIIPPNGFLILRGSKANVPPAGVVDVVVKDTDNNMCLAGGSYSRFWFRNAGSWFAFYNKAGVVQDMIKWGDPYPDDLNKNPCIPVKNSLLPFVKSLSSYNASGLGNHLGDIIVGQTFVRMPDGGDWSTTMPGEYTSYGSCNEIGACQNGKSSSTCTGTATVIPTSGTAPFTYLWNDFLGQTTQTAITLCSGDYIATVKDSKGINTNYSVSVLDDFLKINSLEITQPSCPGETGSATVNLSKSGTYTYDWNPIVSHSNSAINLSDGTFKISIADEFCPIDTSFKISKNISNIVFSVDDAKNCTGNVVKFNNTSSGVSNGKSTFEWDFGDGTTSTQTSPSHTYLNAGVYNIYIKSTSEKGCVQDSTVLQMIDVNVPPIVNLGNDTTICANANITLIAGTGFTSYLWSPKLSTSNTLTTTDKGNYSLTITDENGCTGNDDLNLNMSPELFIDLGNDSAFCDGNSTTLSVQNSGVSLVWNTGETLPSISVNSSGIYHVAILDQFKCTYRDSVEIFVVPYPTFANIIGDTLGCIGDEEILTLETDAEKILWQNLQTTISINIQQSGTYQAVASNVKNQANCSIQDEISVVFYTYPKNIEPEDQSFCFEFNDTLTISTPTLAAYYDWGKGRTFDSTYTVFSEGIYQVSVYDYTMCQVGQDIVVEEKCPIRVYVPNTFTPNGDGLNDFYFPTLVNETDFEFHIFNRWGELIFTSTNVNQPWDGTFKGRLVQMDVYVWKLIANGYNEKVRKTQINQHGTVLVLR